MRSRRKQGIGGIRATAPERSKRSHMRRALRVATDQRIAAEQALERDTKRKKSRLEMEDARKLFAKLPKLAQTFIDEMKRG